MGGGQNIKSLEKVDSKTLMDNFEGLKTSVVAVTADVVGKTRGLEVEAEDMTAVVQPRGKNLMDKELLRWMSKVVPWDEIYYWWRCCEDCWNDNKDLEYYINLVDVAVGVYEFWLQFWKNFYCG